MLNAEKELSGSANLGEVDVDRNRELAKAVRLLNVPAVGYYQGGQLVALLTGSRQNVRRRLERSCEENPSTTRTETTKVLINALIGKVGTATRKMLD